MTCGSARTSAGRAVGDQAAELDHVEVVAHVEHEAHVVVDEQDRRRRCRRIRAQPPAERAGSRSVSSPAAGSSMQTSCGARGQRPRDADELALPLADRRRARGRAARASAEQCRARDSTRVAVAPAAGPHQVERGSRADDWRSAATCRFSATVRSSNSSSDCHVRARPSRAAPVRRECRSSSRPAKTMPPGRRDEAGERVDERRLAGAVRPDQPDELARVDARSSSSRARSAAERDPSGPASRAAAAHRCLLAAPGPARGRGRARRVRPATDAVGDRARSRPAIPSGLRIAVTMSPRPPRTG